MAIQGQQPWMTEIIAAHLPGMKPEIKRALVGLARGVSRAELARREVVSPDTIKDWIQVGTELIGSHLTTEHANHAELRGLWVAFHCLCCLKDEVAAVDTGAASPPAPVEVPPRVPGRVSKKVPARGTPRASGGP